MSLYNGPPRPGARGGRAEFSWENVKADKDREYYLGHSVKATTGRWAKGKDVFWYTKGKGDNGVSQDELEAVKQREREMMAEALGLKPKSAPKQLKQPSLEKHEVDKLLRGGAAEDDDEAGAAAVREAERVKGLGFNLGSAVAVREEVREVMQGTGLPGPPSGAAGRTAAGADRLMTAEQLAKLDEADRKAARKAEKKDKKKAKKAKKEKKEKKLKHKKHRHRSFSTGSSSSSSCDSEDDRRQRNSHHAAHKQQQQQQWQERGHHDYRSHDYQHVDGGRGRGMPPVKRAEQQYAGARRHSRSRSPAARRQQYSRSPARRRQYSRSRSPAVRTRHGASRSPPAQRQYSRSAAGKHGRSRSRSPAGRHGRSRSKSPAAIRRHRVT